MQYYGNNYNYEQAADGDNPLNMREAVGVFDTDDQLLAAIDDLEIAQFQRKDFSVLAGEGEMRKAYGVPYRNPYNIEEDEKAPRGVFVTPEEHSLAEASLVGGGIILAVFLFGPLLGPDLEMPGTTLVLLVLAAIGGVAGWLAVLGLRHLRQRRTEGQLNKGGMLLWVNTPTREHEHKARDILLRHGAHDVHIHVAERPVAA